ncbi:MAG TPA: acyl-CoA dehydrogenase C-terminal domain-containing protein, partial [Rhodanobacteraceae bacterium]
QQQGAGLKLFLEEIAAFCAQHAGNDLLKEFIAPLAAVTKEWADLTQAIGKRGVGNADEIGAAAVDYLFYSGYVALAYFWARSVAAAQASPQGGDFRQAKLLTARFYFSRLLPRTTAHRMAIEAGAESLFAMPDKLFG